MTYGVSLTGMFTDEFEAVNYEEAVLEAKTRLQNSLSNAFVDYDENSIEVLSNKSGRLSPGRYRITTRVSFTDFYKADGYRDAEDRARQDIYFQLCSCDLDLEEDLKVEASWQD
jgi:hypothetical protein